MLSDVRLSRFVSTEVCSVAEILEHIFSGSCHLLCCDNLGMWSRSDHLTSTKIGYWLGRGIVIFAKGVKPTGSHLCKEQLYVQNIPVVTFL